MRSHRLSIDGANAVKSTNGTNPTATVPKSSPRKSTTNATQVKEDPSDLAPAAGYRNHYDIPPRRPSLDEFLRYSGGAQGMEDSSFSLREFKYPGFDHLSGNVIGKNPYTNLSISKEGSWVDTLDDPIITGNISTITGTNTGGMLIRNGNLRSPRSSLGQSIGYTGHVGSSISAVGTGVARVGQSTGTMQAHSSDRTSMSNEEQQATSQNGPSASSGRYISSNPMNTNSKNGSMTVTSPRQRRATTGGNGTASNSLSGNGARASIVLAKKSPLHPIGNEHNGQGSYQSGRAYQSSHGRNNSRNDSRNGSGNSKTRDRHWRKGSRDLSQSLYSDDSGDFGISDSDNDWGDFETSRFGAYTKNDRRNSNTPVGGSQTAVSGSSENAIGTGFQNAENRESSGNQHHSGGGQSGASRQSIISGGSQHVNSIYRKYGNETAHHQSYSTHQRGSIKKDLAIDTNLDREPLPISNFSDSLTLTLEAPQSPKTIRESINRPARGSIFAGRNSANGGSPSEMMSPTSSVIHGIMNNLSGRTSASYNQKIEIKEGSSETLGSIQADSSGDKDSANTNTNTKIETRKNPTSLVENSAISVSPDSSRRRTVGGLGSGMTPGRIPVSHYNKGIVEEKRELHSINGASESPSRKNRPSRDGQSASGEENSAHGSTRNSENMLSRSPDTTPGLLSKSTELGSIHTSISSSSNPSSGSPNPSRGKNRTSMMESILAKKSTTFLKGGDGIFGAGTGPAGTDSTDVKSVKPVGSRRSSFEALFYGNNSNSLSTSGVQEKDRLHGGNGLAPAGTHSSRLNYFNSNNKPGERSIILDEETKDLLTGNRFISVAEKIEHIQNRMDTSNEEFHKDMEQQVSESVVKEKLAKRLSLVPGVNSLSLDHPMERHDTFTSISPTAPLSPKTPSPTSRLSSDGSRPPPDGGRKMSFIERRRASQAQQREASQGRQKTHPGKLDDGGVGMVINNTIIGTDGKRVSVRPKPEEWVDPLLNELEDWVKSV